MGAQSSDYGPPRRAHRATVRGKSSIPRTAEHVAPIVPPGYKGGNTTAYLFRQVYPDGRTYYKILSETTPEMVGNGRWSLLDSVDAVDFDTAYRLAHRKFSHYPLS
jgi:hypothetical protein